MELRIEAHYRPAAIATQEESEHVPVGRPERNVRCARGQLRRLLGFIQLPRVTALPSSGGYAAL